MVDGSDGARIAELERRVAELTLENRRLAAKLDASRGLGGPTERMRWEGQEAQPERHWQQRMMIFEHEALEPLHVLSGLLQIPRGSDVTHGPDPEALELTEHYFRHLTQAVVALIWIHRIDFGVVRLQDWKLKRCPLEVILQDAVDKSRPFFRAPDRTVTVELPAAPVWMLADSELLVRMVVNLLFDISKRTGAGHRIEVRAVLEGDEVVLHLTDDGMGPILSSADRFVYDNGLFLARELAELHGGTARAQRDDEHGHNTFVIHLPLGGAESVSCR